MEEKGANFCFYFNFVRKNEKRILRLDLKNLLSRNKEFSFSEEYIFLIKIRIIVNTKL